MALDMCIFSIDNPYFAMKLMCVYLSLQQVEEINNKNIRDLFVTWFGRICDILLVMLIFTVRKKKNWPSKVSFNNVYNIEGCFIYVLTYWFSDNNERNKLIVAFDKFNYSCRQIIYLIFIIDSEI